MDRQSLRLFQNLPLPPAGQEFANSWIIDTTGPHLTRRTWPSHLCPYKYSAAGTWLRLAMGRDKRRSDKVMRTLTEWVPRTFGELHDAARLPRDLKDYEGVAAMLMFRATLVERETPFVIVNVWHSGFAEFYSGAHDPPIARTAHVDVIPPGWS